MALPALTPQQRAEALEKATQARRARSQLVEEIKTGQASIEAVLARAATDPIVAKTRINVLVRAVPGHGPAKASAALKKVGIAEGRRVGGLGPNQAEALISELS
jgi:Asp/Glu/hydantoin racemase